PSLTRNIGEQSVQAGEVIVTSIIAARDLELPSGDEEGETQVEQPAAEVTSSGRKNKRKELAPVYETESPPYPPAKFKRLRKRTVVEYVATEEPAAVPTTTFGTDEELRKAFEAVEQEKERGEEEKPHQKTKEVEEE
ncbi:PREDICTED: LOC109946780, partial [Prunus dulcis]